MKSQKNVWKVGAERAVRGPGSMGATLESWILSCSEGVPMAVCFPSLTFGWPCAGVSGESWLSPGLQFPPSWCEKRRGKEQAE